MTNSQPPDEPLFGIGDVTHITGIPEATLRVWERRYAFPLTTRSAGGRRLYAQRTVLELLWVKLHLDEGMRAGRAIAARHLVRRDAAVAAALHEALPVAGTADPALVAVRPALLDTLLAFEGARATALLDEISAQHPLDRVVLELIGPTLATIGDAWNAGEVDVATEHFATHLLLDNLLLWMRTSPPPYRVRPVVLACAPEELHEGSLLMLGVLLRRRRWPVLYLGQSLPLAELPGLVARVGPALVVFVAMSESAALALADWPRWLSPAAQSQPPIVGYGGRAFTQHPTLSERVPGILLGTTLDEGSQRIHRLLLNLNVLQN